MTRPIRSACKSTKAGTTITLNAPIPRCHSAMPQRRAAPHSASSTRITPGAKQRRRDGKTGGIAASIELERFPLDLNRKGYRGFPRACKSDSVPATTTAGGAMAKGCSKDLRVRVVSIVEEGDSAREAARLLNVGASTAIRWIERWTTTGSVEAKPGTGHSRSPLNKHEQWLLDLVAAEPDLTLDDIRLRLSGAKKLKVGTSSIWRFYDRHEITFKKNSARRRAGSS